MVMLPQHNLFTPKVQQLCTTYMHVHRQQTSLRITTITTTMRVSCHGTNGTREGLFGDLMKVRQKRTLVGCNISCKQLTLMVVVVIRNVAMMSVVCDRACMSCTVVELLEYGYVVVVQCTLVRTHNTEGRTGWSSRTPVNKRRKT